MDPFVGEIRLFSFSYPPVGWALCDGSLLPLRTYTQLFSLLGTTFGGDGRTTFGLPDLRGRTYVGMGQGAGLSQYFLGTVTGTENVTLLQTQLPPHAHGLSASLPVNAGAATSSIAAGSTYATIPRGTVEQYAFDPLPGGRMAPDLIGGTTGVVGGSQGHENRMPFLVMNYCIATAGSFPPRQ